MFDQVDLPGHLHDAYKAALDNGLLSINLTRVGTDTRMWQASSRFVKSSGFHVEIKANAVEAVMAALRAHTRIVRLHPPASSTTNLHLRVTRART